MGSLMIASFLLAGVAGEMVEPGMLQMAQANRERGELRDQVGDRLLRQPILR